MAWSGQTGAAVAGRRLSEGLGLTRRIATRHQSAQGLEEVVWKLVPAEPRPAFAFFGLTDLRRAMLGPRQHEHGDVVVAFGGHDVVCVRTEPDHMNAKTGFLLGFAGGTVLDRLTKLEMTTWQGPTPSTVRAFALAEKNLALALNYDSDANTRKGSLVLAVHAAVRCAGCLNCEA